MVAAKKLLSGVSESADWSTVRMDGPGTLMTNAPSSVSYGPSSAIITLSGSTNIYLYSSDNGVSWVSRTFPTTGVYSQSIWTGHPSYGFMVFKNSATGSGSAYYSVDGITWSPMSIPVSATWVDVTLGSAVSRIVMVSSSTSIAYTATGSGWSSASNSFAARSVTYDPGSQSYITVGDGASSSKSSGTNGTGSSWTGTGTMPVNTSWKYVTHGNGKLIAIPASGAFAAVSTNGATSWSQVSLPANTLWSKVIYALGRFWITPLINNVPFLSSSDGETWVSHGPTDINLIATNQERVIGVPASAYQFAKGLITVSPSAGSTNVSLPSVATSISVTNTHTDCPSLTSVDINGVTVVRGLSVPVMSTKSVEMRVPINPGDEVKVYSSKSVTFDIYGVEL